MTGQAQEAIDDAHKQPAEPVESVEPVEPADEVTSTSEEISAENR